MRASPLSTNQCANAVGQAAGQDGGQANPSEGAPTAKPCDDRPCGGGKCSDIDDKSYSCNCPKGDSGLGVYSGGGVNKKCHAVCEFNKTSCGKVGQQLDEGLVLHGQRGMLCLESENRTCKACDTAPCGSGGKCKDLVANSYSCLCDSNGWEGGGINTTCSPVCKFNTTSCGYVDQVLATTLLLPGSASPSSCEGSNEAECTIDYIRGEYCIHRSLLASDLSKNPTFSGWKFLYNYTTDVGHFTFQLADENHLRNHGMNMKLVDTATGEGEGDVVMEAPLRRSSPLADDGKYVLDFPGFAVKVGWQHIRTFKMHMYFTTSMKNDCTKRSTQYDFEGPVSNEFKVFFDNDFTTEETPSVSVTEIVFGEVKAVEKGLAALSDPITVEYSLYPNSGWKTVSTRTHHEAFYAKFHLNDEGCYRVGKARKLHVLSITSSTIIWGGGDKGPSQSEYPGANLLDNNPCETIVFFPEGVWLPSDGSFDNSLNDDTAPPASYTATFTTCALSNDPGEAFKNCTEEEDSTQRRLGSNTAALRAEGASRSLAVTEVTEVTEVYRGSTNQFTLHVVRDHGHQVLIHEEDQAWSWGILLLLVGGIVMCAGGGMYARSGQRDEREERYIPVAADANDVHEPLVLKTQHMHGPRTKHT